MREILFRGKTVNTHEWVEGSLITSAAYPNRAWITESKTFFDKQLQNVGIVEVDHDTVGQYTDILDKNGVKVCEGDIVKFKRSYEEYRMGSIIFEDGTFWIKWIDERDDERLCGFHDIQEMQSVDWLTYHLTFPVEVIGNKFDCTELMKDAD